MKKRGGGGDEGGSWMDTYGDLVTLLLTFFVLLYSMSSLDQAKWDVFVRSIFPNGRPGEESAEQIVLNGQVTNEDGKGSVGDGSVPPNEVNLNDPKELYLQIAKALNDAGISGVEVSRGEDYTFVVFKDKAFFNGDSSVITPQGQETLTVFCNALADQANEISQVNIMGLFIQGRGIISPDKLVSIGYGQFHPIAENDSSEGRAKNRRVEILLIDQGAQIRGLDEYFQEYYSGKNSDKTIVTDGVPENIQAEQNGQAPQEVAGEGNAEAVPAEQPQAVPAEQPQAETVDAGATSASE